MNARASDNRRPQVIRHRYSTYVYIYVYSCLYMYFFKNGGGSAKGLS